MPAVADVIDFLHKFAPLHLAEEWDNVGLLVGDVAGPAECIMTCLTVTPESAAEAVEAGVGLMVSHHPVLFRPSKRLTAGTPEGKMLLSLIRAGVAVYSPHTAFDNTLGGINDMIADRLGLTDLKPLRPGQAGGAFARIASYKIAVFVPEQDLHKVADAMFTSGAGHIGPYSQCSFRMAGTGTFFGSEASNPTIGQKGRREEAHEYRLEIVCPADVLGPVIAALRRAHSYEEPAYDIYPLTSDPARAQDHPGQGRIGKLTAPLPLGQLAQMVRTALGASHIQLVGDQARPVQKLAIVCGAGGEFTRDAVRQQADVLLTGEARFHDCLAAEAQGLALLLPGHFASERPGVEALAGILQRQFPAAKVWASQRERDPLSSL